MKTMISQGTISVLFGCHSVVHSLLIMKAWKRIYGTWPEPWQTICILLHDVGHVGYDYLDDPKAKAEHWQLGADLAGALYGPKGYRFVAGHCQGTGFQESQLYLADKTAWSIAPLWLLFCQQVVEPKLTPKGKTKWQHAKDFRAWTKANVATGKPRDTHEGYLELHRMKAV